MEPPADCANCKHSLTLLQSKSKLLARTSSPYYIYKYSYIAMYRIEICIRVNDKLGDTIWTYWSHIVRCAYKACGQAAVVLEYAG